MFMRNVDTRWIRNSCGRKRELGECWVSLGRKCDERERLERKGSEEEGEFRE